jgi:hypothetical protein
MLELRWLPSEMTDGAFKATLALFAWEAEKVRPSFLLIDATQFRHKFGPGVMQWRDDSIIPRYGAVTISVGGGPTDDKPNVTLVPPSADSGFAVHTAVPIRRMLP